jgi:DNA replication protein DnaC
MLTQKQQTSLIGCYSMFSMVGKVKSTIFTTNLTGERLEGAYDERIVSRIFNNFRAIVFKDTKDYRRKALPF